MTGNKWPRTNQGNKRPMTGNKWLRTKQGNKKEKRERISLAYNFNFISVR